MNSFYNLLIKIKEKPALYIGSISLNKLYDFICGYSACLEQHNLLEERKFFDGFQDFVQKKLNIDLTPLSWAHLIEKHNEDDKASFYMFYDLLEEHLDNEEHRKLL